MTETLTFLFTDIEGSTRLWEKYPEAMGLALERHDELMREAITSNKGSVFKTIGDAFCAAFEDPRDALSAVVKAQLALHKEQWPGKVEIKVRMGLNTGECEARGDDYFGQALNRTARLMSAGHGAQIIISEATRNLIQHPLPKGVTLQSLGRHRLKDLQEAEPIYQVRHADLPVAFPPIKSLDNPNLPNNLPQQLTSFIGRHQQLEDVKDQLTKTRLLTLTGSGGCGKSRLALQVGAEVLDMHADGVWLVELAPITDPKAVAHAVAHVLAVKDKHGSPYEYTLVNAIRGKRMLLIIDNCEHLISACAFLFETILKNCPYITVLASSREPINIVGESTFRVPSLSAPKPSEKVTKDKLLTYEAVRLFVERAVLVDPQFAVTDDNVDALSRLCFHLDGIPLAIELAAARVRSMSVDDINSKIDDRFRLLTGGSRTALARHQTLRATIDWSYDLLSEAERLLLCRLSVFAGGSSLESAEAVASGEGVDEYEVLDLMTSLTDKSLVSVEKIDGLTRYRLLETVRQYGKDKLREAGVEMNYGQKHADYYLKFANEGISKLRTPGEVEALRKLDLDLDDLRAATTWSKNAGLKNLYASLALALGRVLMRRGFLPEARANIQGGLDTTDGQDKRLTAELLQERAGLHLDYEEPVEARHLAETCAPMFAELGDAVGQAKTENIMAQAAMQEGDYDTARSKFETALERYRSLGNKIDEAIVLNNLGIVERRDHSGDRAVQLDKASEYLSKAVALRRELVDRRGLAESLNNMGVIEQEKGDLDSAWQHYSEALKFEEDVRNSLGVAILLANLGEVAEQKGDKTMALKLFAASEVSLRELQSPRADVVAEMTNRVAADSTMAENARADARSVNGSSRAAAALKTA